ncbi:hypothetical protein HK101_004681 [Irineochytrium annulatum]|nr:hypothetical protein HK101_004681 [Irineochytrium annulatum]
MQMSTLPQPQATTLSKTATVDARNDITALASPTASDVDPDDSGRDPGRDSDHRLPWQGAQVDSGHGYRIADPQSEPLYRDNGAQYYRASASMGAAVEPGPGQSSAPVYGSYSTDMDALQSPFQQQQTAVSHYNPEHYDQQRQHEQPLQQHLSITPYYVQAFQHQQPSPISTTSIASPSFGTAPQYASQWANSDGGAVAGQHNMMFDTAAGPSSSSGANLSMPTGPSNGSGAYALLTPPLMSGVADAVEMRQLQTDSSSGNNRFLPNSGQGLQHPQHQQPVLHLQMPQMPSQSDTQPQRMSSTHLQQLGGPRNGWRRLINNISVTPSNNRGGYPRSNI